MNLSRRDVLKGASLGVGSLMMSTILSRLQAEAAGDLSHARRFVFVVEGNGLPWAQIQPEGIARNNKLISNGSYTDRSTKDFRTGVTDLSLADYQLPPALEP